MAWRDSLIISTNRGLRFREMEVLVFEGTIFRDFLLYYSNTYSKVIKI